MKSLNGVTFDVVDDSGIEWSITRLLALLVDNILPMMWRVDIEMAPGPQGERVRRLLPDEVVDGRALIRAFAADPQVVEGEFTGCDEERGRILVIEAVDGMHWNIYSDDEQVLANLRVAIPGCVELA